MIYVNVDSPNLGFPYFNFLGEAQCKKTPCIYSFYFIEPMEPMVALISVCNKQRPRVSLLCHRFRLIQTHNDDGDGNSWEKLIQMMESLEKN